MGGGWVGAVGGGRLTVGGRRISVEVDKMEVAVAVAVARTQVGGLFRLQRRRLIVPLGFS